MEFYTDGSLLVATGDSSQASFDRGDWLTPSCFRLPLCVALFGLILALPSRIVCQVEKKQRGLEHTFSVFHDESSFFMNRHARGQFRSKLNSTTGYRVLTVPSATE